MLVDASHNAALFARGERLALEAVDAGVEALLDEVGVHLLSLVPDLSDVAASSPDEMQQVYTDVHEFLHLLLLHAVLELTLLALCKSARN